MSSKDYFSGHAPIYAAFRPAYPQALYDFILSHLKHRESAWDCGTGNGQVAEILARHFTKVVATDISSQQIEQAPFNAVIDYIVAPAEKTPFPDNVFDLITVAQAFHWFQPDEFFAEVKRVLKKDGLLALWGYSNCQIAPEIDNIFLDFYHNKVGPYWDQARRLVEQEYKTIPFPFQEVASPRFYIKVQWTREHFMGYLESWSATQKFIREQGYNPVPEFADAADKYWKSGEVKEVRFPVFLRLGKISS